MAIYYEIVNGVSYTVLENTACVKISKNTWTEYVKVKGGGGGNGHWGKNLKIKSHGKMKRGKETGGNLYKKMGGMCDAQFTNSCRIATRQ